MVLQSLPSSRASELIFIAVENDRSYVMEMIVVNSDRLGNAPSAFKKCNNVPASVVGPESSMRPPLATMSERTGCVASCFRWSRFWGRPRRRREEEAPRPMRRSNQAEAAEAESLGVIASGGNAGPDGERNVRASAEQGRRAARCGAPPKPSGWKVFAFANPDFETMRRKCASCAAFERSAFANDGQQLGTEEVRGRRRWQVPGGDEMERTSSPAYARWIRDHFARRHCEGTYLDTDASVEAGSATSHDESSQSCCSKLRHARF